MFWHGTVRALLELHVALAYSLSSLTTFLNHAQNTPGVKRQR